MYDDITSPERPKTSAFESGWATQYKSRNLWLSRLLEVAGKNALQAEELKSRLTLYGLAKYHKMYLALSEYATNLPDK